jgi:hypothetical protein
MHFLRIFLFQENGTDTMTVALALGAGGPKELTGARKKRRRRSAGS